MCTAWKQLDPPRSLTQRERDVVRYLLEPDFPGAADLRKQAGLALVSGESGHCPTINFVVDREHSPRAAIRADVIVETTNKHRYDSDDWVELLLFLDNGWLSSLELVHYVNIPSELPAVTELEPPRVRV